MIKKTIIDIYRQQLDRNHHKYGQTLDPEEFLLWLETEPVYSAMESVAKDFINRFDRIFDTFTQEKKELAFDLLIRSAIRAMDIEELEDARQCYYDSIEVEEYHEHERMRAR